LGLLNLVPHPIHTPCPCLLHPLPFPLCLACPHLRPLPNTPAPTPLSHLPTNKRVALRSQAPTLPTRLPHYLYGSFLCCVTFGYGCALFNTHRLADAIAAVVLRFLAYGSIYYRTFRQRVQLCVYAPLVWTLLAPSLASSHPSPHVPLATKHLIPRATLAFHLPHSCSLSVPSPPAPYALAA